MKRFEETSGILMIMFCIIDSNKVRFRFLWWVFPDHHAPGDTDAPVISLGPRCRMQIFVSYRWLHEYLSLVGCCESSTQTFFSIVMWISNIWVKYRQRNSDSQNYNHHWVSANSNYTMWWIVVEQRNFLNWLEFNWCAFSGELDGAVFDACDSAVISRLFIW